MEFDDEHEDQDDEIMEEMPIAHGHYDPVTRPKPGEGLSAARKNGGGGGGGGGSSIIRYRECLKNHAIGIGGQAVDGCGEFMPAGEEGTIESLKCAACNCHRNFHRKVTDSDHPHNYYYHHHQQQQQQFQQISSYRGPPHPSGYVYLTGAPVQQRPLALPPPAPGREEDDDTSNPSSSGGGSGSSKKRFRTKFSQEQKEKMLGFAEKVGWTIQKHDEADVELFCLETGVQRQVLKVWMHNNKHTLGKKP